LSFAASSHPELCVGAVVVVDGSLLLIERGRGAGAGMLSVPGGRLEQAVLRELYEECGLTGDVVRHLGFVERLDDNWHFVIHDYLVHVDRGGLVAARAGDDAAAVVWVPLEAVHSTQGIVPGLVAFLEGVGVL
jgi:8-oxo-dGTP diphosphatase